MKRWLFLLLLLALPADAATVKRRPIVTSGAVCGDTIRNGGEQCDGSDFGSATCADYSCAAGSLSCTGACTIVSSGCTNCANLGRESFNASGYDLTGWTPHTDGSPVVDPDETALCATNANCTASTTPFACCTGSGTGTCAGFSSQCLETSTAANNETYWSAYALAAPQSGPVYCRAYLNIRDTTGLDDTESIIIGASADDGASIDVVASQFRFRLTNNAGTIELNGRCKRTNFGTTTVVAGTTYLVEWFSDQTAEACDMKINGTQKGPAVPDEAFDAAVSYIALGNGTTVAAQVDMVWDNLACDTRGWVGGL